MGQFVCKQCQGTFPVVQYVEGSQITRRRFCVGCRPPSLKIGRYDESSKECRGCKVVKQLSEFPWATNKGAYAARCKDCQSVAQRAYYSENKEHHMKAVKARRERIREENRKLLGEYLANHPCVDCGEPDPVVLEFDHVRGEKYKGVTQIAIADTGSWSRVLEEIAKCDVRCANCHRRRTAKSRGYWTVS